MKTFLAFISVLLLAAGTTYSQTRLKEDITCQQAAELIQKFSADTSFVILDVRTPDEFKSGHLEKAIMIDFKSADFKDNVSKLDKNRKYLVYCKRGGRSAAAVLLMRDLGFADLYHLYEGIDVWKTSGNKTVTD